ncbi:MAG: hypothetical protein R8K20_10250 [Gallionellaceae bacterium]
MWQVQYLEHALVSFVVMKRHKRNPSTEEEAYARLAKERKGTLGSIYGRAKEEGIIPDSLKPRFNKLIDERNWLIHDSRTANSEDLYDDGKTLSIISRIHNVTDESVELTKLVMKLLDSFILSENIDLNEVYKRADEYIRRLEGV